MYVYTSVQVTCLSLQTRAQHMSADDIAYRCRQMALTCTHFVHASDAIKLIIENKLARLAETKKTGEDVNATAKNVTHFDDFHFVTDRRDLY